MSFDLHTLKNLEKAIDKQFGSKEAHIYYSDDLAKTTPYLAKLEKRELPGFSIVFSNHASNKFRFYRSDSDDFKFSKDHTPNDVVSLIKLSVIQNPKYFDNNHVSIFINKSEQLKYLDSIKSRMNVIKEYQDTDGY